ncbi:hypothetical protein BDZ97DRAFT_1820622 [Flammula alnicola]|nr:hypothetical protein BDZ97DRAFT_1820622 [Flammula alnicola]
MQADSIDLAQASSSPALDSDESDGEAPRRIKNRQTKKRRIMPNDSSDSELAPVKPRSKRGILKVLVEMPLDVLFEIFGMLEPLDLLYLARSTKDIRAILMNRSSISIWRRSRSNIPDMPECPDDLSEPQYANLAFAKNCYFCDKNLSTNRIIWSARLRTCTKCLHTNFIRMHEEWIQSRKYPEALAFWIPTIVVSERSGRSADSFALRSLDRLWKDEYSNIDDDRKKLKWLARKVKERKVISAHADKCSSWFEDYKEELDKRRVVFIDERKAVIVKLVKRLGWGEELARMSEDKPQDQPNVVRACRKELTSRVLSNLEPVLDEYMAAAKSQRLEQEYRTCLEEREPILREAYEEYVASTFAADAVYPTAGELLFDSAVEDCIQKTPTADFTKELLHTTMRSAFPTIAQKWKENNDGKLRELIAEACGPEYVFNPHTVLHLATTFFSCSSCGQCRDSFQYPRVLMHSCSKWAGYSYWSPDAHTRIIGYVLNDGHWNRSKVISFKKESLQLMTHVVRMCGFDPATTTARKMDEVAPIIECVSCNDVREGRATMSWKAVIEHQRTTHKKDGKNEMKLEVLNEPESTGVKEQMNKLEGRRRADERYLDMACAHCKKTGNTVDLAKHVKKEHGKQHPTSDDIVPILDRDHTPPLYWLWPPREDEEPTQDVQPDSVSSHSPFLKYHPRRRGSRGSRGFVITDSGSSS